MATSGTGKVRYGTTPHRKLVIKETDAEGETGAGVLLICVLQRSFFGPSSPNKQSSGTEPAHRCKYWYRGETSPLNRWSLLLGDRLLAREF